MSISTAEFNKFTKDNYLLVDRLDRIGFTRDELRNELSQEFNNVCNTDDYKKQISGTKKFNWAAAGLVVTALGSPIAVAGYYKNIGNIPYGPYVMTLAFGLGATISGVHCWIEADNRREVIREEAVQTATNAVIKSSIKRLDTSFTCN